MSGDGVRLPAIDPAVRALEHDCLRLRDQLARLLSERDELRWVVLPNVEAEYLSKLGTKEQHLLAIQLEVRRWRRAVELAQAAINAGEPPSRNAIERRLDAELARWYEQLAAADVKLQQAIAGLDQRLSVEDTAELKRLYRRLALRLHPDVAGLEDERARALWDRVAAAYAAGDLAELRALWLVAGELLADAPQPATVDQLTARKAKLAEAIAQAIETIAAIWRQPPMDLLEQLADDHWIAARLAELQAQIEAAVVRRDELRRMALEMIGEEGHERRGHPH